MLNAAIRVSGRHLLPNLAVALVTLTACFALKLHYSLASAGDLRWMLAPTSWLVHTLSGYAFEFEPQTGFVSTAAAVSITPACAGLNYLLIAWASLVFGIVTQLPEPRAKLLGLLATALAALAATLLVNSARIMLAIALHREHRIEGIALYLSSLWLLYLAVQAIASKLASNSPAQQP